MINDFLTTVAIRGFKAYDPPDASDDIFGNEGSNAIDKVVAGALYAASAAMLAVLVVSAVSWARVSNKPQEAAQARSRFFIVLALTTFVGSAGTWFTLAENVWN